GVLDWELFATESSSLERASTHTSRRRFFGAASEPRLLGQLVEKYLRALNELGVCNRGRSRRAPFFSSPHPSFARQWSERARPQLPDPSPSSSDWRQFPWPARESEPAPSPSIRAELSCSRCSPNQRCGTVRRHGRPLPAG